MFLFLWSLLAGYGFHPCSFVATLGFSASKFFHPRAHLHCPYHDQNALSEQCDIVSGKVAGGTRATRVSEYVRPL